MPTPLRPLYRSAAVDAQRTRQLGEIVLICPLSFTFLSALAVALAGVVGASLVWGSYTKRSTVAGQLVPDSGLIKVYPQQSGVVVRKMVSEGQVVDRDEVLYVVSSERRSSTQGDTQASISKHAAARQASLREELGKTQQLHKNERETLARKVTALQDELTTLNRQLVGQARRVQLAEEALTHSEALNAQGFLSGESLRQRQSDVLDQASQLQILERSRIGVGRELVALRADLNGLRLKHENQLALIERSISTAEQERTESEARRQLLITAPQAGTAAAVVAEVGQVVDVNRPLVSIVPSGAKMQAHLYAPSRAIGFIKPGDPVLLRYESYPYQKFGHQRGTVATVSRTVFSSTERAGAGNVANAGVGAPDEPLYRVTVDLASQSIDALGQPRALQPGMLLQADVLLERRRLYEWALEPLYSLSGKF